MVLTDSRRRGGRKPEELVEEGQRGTKESVRGGGTFSSSSATRPRRTPLNFDYAHQLVLSGVSLMFPPEASPQSLRKILLRFVLEYFLWVASFYFFTVKRNFVLSSYL